MPSSPTGTRSTDGEPQVSVVMPAYNVAAFVGDAIRSALAQRDVDLEVLVVDDGSNDGTRQILTSFEGDPRVRTFYQDHGGPSVSRNTALAAARGRYVGFLDADDLWEPTKAAKHVAVMDANPALDVTYSWWRTIDERSRDTGRRTTVPAARVPGGTTFAGLVIENFTGTASSVFCRRSAARAVGGFDPALRSNVDLDFLLRVAALRPGNIALVPEILTAYRMRAHQITASWRRMQENWQHVIAKAAAIAPAEVARVQRQALARQSRYYAYLAYEAGDLPAARRLLRAAWRQHTGTLARDRRAWLTTAAVLASYLPESIHRTLANAARSWRARRAHT
jgi:glycosyltransferase involved in cell wall biosynthesis